MLAIAGCGGSNASIVPVSGKVVIDGQPLTSGSIRFVPTKGRPSSGKIQPDGTFELTYLKEGDGALIGPHRIEVASSESLSPVQTKWNAPKSYASVATSGLTIELTESRDDVVVELTWGSAKGPFVEQHTASGF